MADDVLKALFRAKKISYLDKLDNLKVPISGALRRNLNIPLHEAALASISKFPIETNKARIYFGLEGDELVFVPDILRNGKPGSEFLDGSYDEYVSFLRQHDPNIDIDFIVEHELLENQHYKDFFNIEEKQIFLSNFDGYPWRIRKIKGRNNPVIEIKSNLFIDINEASIGEIISLLEIQFFRDDLKVISLFEEGSDRRTIDAIKNAAGPEVPYFNVSNKQNLKAIIEKEKGKVIAIVGHVEDKNFVIRNSSDVEVARISIEELQSIALKKQSSLLFLGCETGKIPGVPGPINKINSLVTASQLKEAIKSKSYAEFFTSLGSVDSPFIVTKSVLDNAEQLVVRRIRENNQIKGATISTIWVSTKLPSSQAAFSRQLFKFLPGWLNNIILLIMSIIIISIPLSLIISILSFSLKPIKFTIGIIVKIFSLPFIGVFHLYRFVIKPKANPDRVH